MAAVTPPADRIHLEDEGQGAVACAMASGVDGGDTRSGTGVGGAGGATAAREARPRRGMHAFWHWAGVGSDQVEVQFEVRIECAL